MPKARRNGLISAFIGLGCGIVLGLCIQSLKSYVGRELVTLLEEEVKASCDCQFKLDDIRISLLTLRAVAKNARIEEQGQRKLYFRRLEGDFSLKRALDNKILLNELRLIDGHSLGVGPESATFKFIDYLAAPIPPERDRPDKWKLKLQRLKLYPSTFVEQINGSELSGKGVTLQMHRTKQDNFELTPAIKKLELKSSGSDSADLSLENISAGLHITDDQIEFRKLRLGSADSWAEINAVTLLDESSSLSGEVSYQVESKSFEAPAWLKWAFVGAGDLSGTLKRPKSELKFEALPPGVTVGDEELGSVLSLDVVKGALNVAKTDKGVSAKVTELEARGERTALSLLSPIQHEQGRWSGSLLLNLPILELPHLEAHGVKTEILLSGSTPTPNIVVTGSVGNLTLLGNSLGPTTIVLENRPKELLIEVSGQEQSYHVKGVVGLDKGEVKLNSCQFLSNDLELGHPSSSPRPKLTAQGEVKGVLTTTGLNGKMDGKLELVKFGTPYFLEGQAELSGGVLKGQIEERAGLLSQSMTLDLTGNANSTINLKLKTATSTADKEGHCLDVAINAQYSFSKLNYEVGKGNILVEHLAVGCAPYTMSLPSSHMLTIDGGKLRLNKIELAGTDSYLSTNGVVDFVNGFDLEASGKIELHTLLPLLPTVDDLRGVASGEVHVGGSIVEPTFNGELRVNDGELWLEASDISAEEVTGKVLLDGEQLKIDSVRGIFNGGTFELQGGMHLRNISQNEFRVALEQVLFQPADNTSITLSGDLTMQQGEGGRPVIKGMIIVDQAEFEQTIDLPAILRTITRYILSRRAARKELATLPEVDLDIQVKATHNMFVVTNFLAAELKADLHIAGSLKSPVVRGGIETVSGSLGLRERFFDITSGVITFRPDSLEPMLELVGETYVRSRTGDNVLVVLEASGTLLSPKVDLSSDRGLTERELLDLLASPTTYIRRTRANTLSTDLELDDDAWYEDVSFFGLGRLVRDLTRIDSFGVEPTYSARSGAIEPTFIARKRLTDRVTLMAESLVAGTESESKLRLLYDLTPKVNVAGIADSGSSEERTSLGADVTWTILAEHKEFLVIEVLGNKSISRSNILTQARLNPNSRVPVSELNRITNSIQNLYASRGHFSSAVSGSCRSKGDLEYCRNILIEVEEGELSTVSEVRFEGEMLDPIIKIDDLTKSTPGAPATARLLRRLEAQMLRRLRSEGYVGARVNARYENTFNSDRKVLVISSHIGKPISFIFRGNKLFTPADFFETINLFGRKHPFGANTINILVKNIARKYQQAGYLNVSIEWEKQVSPSSERVTYIVDINEGERVKVSEVIFHGSANLSADALRNILDEESPADAESIFTPAYAVESEIDDHAQLIKAIYVEEGFPHAVVEYVIVPDAEGRYAQIHYYVEEGEPERATTVRVVGYPPEVILPTALEPPVSYPKVNRYIESMSDRLAANGYYNAEITTRLESGGSELIIEVAAGKQALIGAVSIEGNISISSSIIERNLAFKAGDAWVEDKLVETRRKLLKLGLFSRVSLEPNDGEVNSAEEDLVVRVIERPLRTLEVGGGANSENGLHIFGEASDKSIFSDGRSLSLRVDTFYDSVDSEISEGIAGLRFADPYLFNTNFGLNEDLRYQKLEQSSLEFDLDRLSLASYVYRNWDDEGLTVSSGHTILQEDLTNVTPDVILSDLDKGTVNLSFISGIITFDQRDNPLNPTKGYNFSFDYRFAGETIGSDANYYGVGARFSALSRLPLLSRRFGVAFNTRVGAAWGYNDTEAIPISQRYYAGGRDSMRGFRENSLGPRGVDGGVIGGDVLFTNNFELRYLLAEAAAVHTFLDVGDVYLMDLGIEGVRVSTGVGIRYLSPIGPIGFDVGHPLDEKVGEPSVRVHFSIGSNF